MTTLRPLWAFGVVAWTAVSACQGSKATTSVVCTPYASAQELCDSQVGCDPTWTAVETDHAYCGGCSFSFGTYGAGDCGDYRVLTFRAADSGSTAYYRRDTGALVAVDFYGSPNPTATCAAVATEAFSRPANCDFTMFSALAGWCAPDAGTPLPPSCSDGGAAP